MAFASDTVLDGSLQILATNGDRITLCSQEPTTYNEAITTFKLGSQTGITVGNPETDPSGRKVVVPAIPAGASDTTGVATHWALVDTAGTELLATNTLNVAKTITAPDTWSLAAFDIVNEFFVTA